MVLNKIIKEYNICLEHRKNQPMCEFIINTKCAECCSLMIEADPPYNSQELSTALSTLIDYQNRAIHHSFYYLGSKSLVKLMDLSADLFLTGRMDPYLREGDT